MTEFHRLTYFQNLNSMVDAAKYADLVLIGVQLA